MFSLLCAEPLPFNAFSTFTITNLQQQTNSSNLSTSTLASQELRTIYKETQKITVVVKSNHQKPYSKSHQSGLDTNDLHKF